MKNKSTGIIELLLSVLIFVLINTFYWKVLSLFGLNFSGDAYIIANFIKHLLILIIVFVIYRRYILAGKTKFSKTWLNSFIYCLSCFVFLIIITVVLNKFLNYLGKQEGITVSLPFTNYFSSEFSLATSLNIITNAIIQPFLLVILFPLGFANIIKKSAQCSLIAGLTYGVIYGINLHTNALTALYLSLTPAITVFMLTYLYKTNQNIVSVVITYICYVLFGVFAINYIM